MNLKQLGQRCQPKVRGTSCALFKRITNLQLGLVLGYGKSERTPQDPELSITVFL